MIAKAPWAGPADAIRSSTACRKRSRLARPVSSSVVTIRASRSLRCLEVSNSPVRYWKTIRISPSMVRLNVPSRLAT